MGLLGFLLLPKLVPAIIGILLIALGIVSVYYGSAVRLLRSLGLGLIITGLVVMFGVSWLLKAFESTEGIVVVGAVSFLILIGLVLFGRKREGEK